MIFNKQMKKIFESIEINNIRPKEGYFIWQKLNCNGHPFWGIGDFCGLSGKTVESSCDLTSLEWNGNEVYICNSDDIAELVVSALKIIMTWKEQMEKEYTDIPFDICLSIDTGDEDISPSATLRFYAVRNGQHYINPVQNELDEFEQPVLIEQINQ